MTLLNQWYPNQANPVIGHKLMHSTGNRQSLKQLSSVYYVRFVGWQLLLNYTWNYTVTVVYLTGVLYGHRESCSLLLLHSGPTVGHERSSSYPHVKCIAIVHPGSDHMLTHSELKMDGPQRRTTENPQPLGLARTEYEHLINPLAFSWRQACQLLYPHLAKMLPACQLRYPKAAHPFCYYRERNPS